MRHQSPVANHRSRGSFISYLLSFVFAVFYVSIGVGWAETKIEQGKIEEAIRTYVLSSGHETSEQVEVHIRRWRDVVVDGNGSVVVKATPATRAPLRGAIPFKVAVWQNERAVRRWMVTAEVRIIENVAVAVRRLERHHMIVSEDFAFQRRDVTGISGGYFTAEIAEKGRKMEKFSAHSAGERGELVGKRMRKTVGIGRIVTRKDVEEPPIIVRGSRVTILVEMGGLIVRVTGRALEDGWKGERIKVRNEASKARLAAEVVDERTVRVAF